MNQPLRVFIGYDETEHDAFAVCEASLRARSSIPLFVEPLVQPALRTAGMYRRMFYVEDGQRFDCVDGKPFSTEFSFTRFLVPALAQYRGVAVFCDSDFMWRADIADMMNQIDLGKPVSCVHHDHDPAEKRKMRHGQVQTKYARKNWSSLMVFNCAHAANRNLTPYQVNTMPGWWLHGMRWLPADAVGEIPLQWNWLEGYNTRIHEPKAVHYTRGTPDVSGMEGAAYADEWREYAKGLAEAA